MAQVKSVRSGLITTAGRVQIQFDKVIVTTGSKFIPVVLRGREKDGALVLDNYRSYMGLGEFAGSRDDGVVWGEGERAMEIADRLAKLEGRIDFGVSFWSHGSPGPPALSVILQFAERAGVRLLTGNLERALGTDRLEALMIDRQVRKCDSLILVPVRRPTVPPTDAEVGPGGVIMVDGSLRSNVPAIMAAGSSARVRGGPPSNSSLDSEPRTSGRVAGANATGQELAVGRARLVEKLAFGCRWSRAGFVEAAGVSRTPGLGVTSQRFDSSACSIVYQKSNGRIRGMETVFPCDVSTGGISALVADGLTLESLAHGGSTDISLISETARLGLRAWSRS